MIKVYYSLTRFRKYDSVKTKGIGFITDEDLIVWTFDNGSKKKRTYQDCIRYCHKIVGTSDQYKGNFTEFSTIEVPDKYGSLQEIEVEIEYELWFKILED